MVSNVFKVGVKTLKMANVLETPEKRGKFGKEGRFYIMNSTYHNCVKRNIISTKLFELLLAYV